MKKHLLLSSLVIVLLLSNVYPALSESDARSQASKTDSMSTGDKQNMSSSSLQPVIGNKDTRRYHLPGMPYYNKVNKNHRVYFDSEAQAIEQGYYKSGTKKGRTSPVAAAGKNETEKSDGLSEPVAHPAVAASTPALSAAPDKKQAENNSIEEKSAPVQKVEASQAPSASPGTEPGKALDKTLNLTLQDCLEIAFKQNRLRAVSGESVKIAEAQYQQALSGHWPQLTFSMTGVRMDEDPTFIFPSQPLPLGAAGQPLAEAIALAQLAKMGVTPSTPGFNTMLASTTQQVMQQLASSTMPAQNVKLMDRDLLKSSLSLVLPIYTGGKVSALAKQAKAGVEVSKVEARQTDLQIVRDVKQYYYGHIFARKLHALGRETLERFEATEAITESVYKHGSGRVKKTDYLRSKMMTSNVRSVVELLKSNEELSKSALANVMGFSWNTPVAVAETEIPFTSYGGNLDTLVARAHQSNPQMSQVRLGLQAREGKIAEARSGHLPVVAFFGNFTHLDNSYDGGLMTDENRNSWQIGVSMELPLFNGLRTTREVQEAKHRLEKLKQESLLLQEGVALQVKNAFLQIARSQGQVTTMKEALTTAVENRDLTVRAYSQDMVETKDVIEAQLMEFIMHSQYLKALYDHQVNAGDLEYIVGSNIYENR